jgi:phage-related minor tail protein
METITYSHVQDLVQQLPPQCLPAAYEMLRELTDRGGTLQSQVDFMRLPLAQRRDILARQAEALKVEYAQSADQRADWQAGDFLDEGSTR